MIKEEPNFYREVYTESGNHVRNMNQLRNTYLSLYVVGAAALVGFSQREAGGLSSPTFGWGLAALSGIGVGLVWITWQYIQKALARQRDITEQVVTDEWWKVLRFGYPKGKYERSGFPSWGWLRQHRLDWYPLAIYAVGAFWGLSRVEDVEVYGYAIPVELIRIALALGIPIVAVLYEMNARRTLKSPTT